MNEEKKRFRIPAFWQAVLATAVSYLIFKFGFPPLLPATLMVQFMIITIIGILLYFAFDDARWTEFKAPILSVLRDDGKGPVRWVFLVAVPLIVAYTVYDLVRPTSNAPVELRQVHPAPPASLKIFDKRFDLATLENPVRGEILDTLTQDKEAGWEKYNEAVTAGRDVYYQNCFFCHGDLLDGTGHYANGFVNPTPINFLDPTIIPQLQESFLFWRISKGAPGLPEEGGPWDSAMPAWENFLTEEEIWDVVLFLYDFNGYRPRVREEHH